MKTIHVLSLAMILALPLTVGCSDDETGGAGGTGGSSSSTGASGGTGGAGAEGGTGTTGGAGGTGTTGGAGGAGGAGVGGTGGAGEGGSGGGAGSAEAQAFCADYETTCTFVTPPNDPNNPHWADEASCIAGFDASGKQDCLVEHLDNASKAETPAESIHCWHAIGEGPCAP